MPRYKKNISVETEEFTMRVGPEGRVVIPAPMRKALGIRPGVRIRGKVVEENKVLLSAENELMTIMRQFQDKAAQAGLDKMTMEEINTIIADVRRERKEKAEKKAKK